MNEVAHDSVTVEDAAGWAARHFGVEAEAGRLVADRDDNFRLEAGQRRWLLKVAAADCSRQVVDMQNALLAHLDGVDLPAAVPRVASTVSGEDCATVVDRHRRQRLVRLLSFIDGRPLARIRPRPRALVRSIGDTLGRLDAALADFDHPGARRELRWDVAQYHWLSESLDVLEGSRRRMVSDLVSEIQREGGSAWEQLPRSVIHNDSNDHNLIVAGSRRGRPRLVGLIDFGDAVRTLTVAEPAIACAYLMMGARDPVRVAVDVVAAYHRRRSVTEEELRVLFQLIQLRLCLTVVTSALSRLQRPTDAYLQVSEQPAWDLLERLAPLRKEATARLRHACGYQVGPRLGSVPPPADVLPELGQSRTVVVDLSVASPGSTGASIEQPVAEAAVESALSSAGARYAIGRYDEARLLYETAGFESATGRRTIHLGVDLFAPAATAVMAPLEGTVHSLADNVEPLNYGPTVILEHSHGGSLFHTLYGHLARETLAAVEPGQVIERGRLIGRLGTAAENGGWAPHLHFQVIGDLLGQRGDFPGVADPDQRDFWTDLCPDPSPLLGLAAEARAPRPPDIAELRSRRDRHLSQSLSLAYSKPLHIVAGRGACLYDACGRRFLDGVNNVAHVGHCHPRVVAAERRQAAVLNTNTRYLHESLPTYARRLCSLLPDRLSVCFLVCSGSEANELALRLARAHTGSREILVLEGGYHGNTGSLVELSHYKFGGPGGSGPADHVHTLPMPDPYRGRFRGADEETGRRYAETVSAELERLLERGRSPGAFLYEPLPGCGGQLVPPPGYFRRAEELVRRAGGVCIADEVQVGFGRVGPAFWAFQWQGASPDIVTMGKPIGNGYPLAAVVTTPEIAASFDNGMEYFNTFGGNPVACEVGLAVLDVVESEQLANRAGELGDWLLGRLRELAASHPVIGEARGIGLFLGIELVSDPEARTPAPGRARYLVEEMKKRGLLLSTDGPDHNVIKFKPPLVFGRSDAEFMLAALSDVLQHDYCRI